MRILFRPTEGPGSTADLHPTPRGSVIESVSSREIPAGVDLSTSPSFLEFHFRKSISQEGNRAHSGDQRYRCKYSAYRRWRARGDFQCTWQFSRESYCDGSDSSRCRIGAFDLVEQARSGWTKREQHDI